MRPEVSGLRVRVSPVVIFGIVALISLAVGVRGFQIAFSDSYRYWDHGTLDFVEYWAAARLLLWGVSPYDPAWMTALQAPLGVKPTDPVMMWNPPWLLTVMAPVLQESFVASAKSWLAFNMLLVWVIAIAAARLYRRFGGASGTSLLLVFLCVIGYPAIPDVMRWGQLGLLLLGAVTLVFKGALEDRKLLVAIGLALLSVKPHIFLIFSAVVLYRCVRTNGFGMLGIIGGTAAIVVSPTLVIQPELVFDWLSHAASPGDESYRGLLYWKGATVPQILKEVFAPDSPWLMVACPIAALLVLLFLQHASFDPRKDVLRELNTALCVSWLFSPYGWYSDSVILALPFAYAVLVLWRAAADPVSYRLLVGIGIVQFLTTFVPTAVDLTSKDMRFHSLVICAFYFTCLYLQRTRWAEQTTDVTSEESQPMREAA